MKSTSLYLSTILIIATAAGWPLTPLPGADDAADAIVQSVAESLKPPKSFSVLSEIETFRDRAAAGTMTLRSYIKISDANEGPRSVSIVLFPEDERGKVFLKVGDSFWLYDPSGKRPVKISIQQRLMGDASLADITHFELKENYTAALEDKETVTDSSGKGVDSQRLLLTARSKDVLYPTLRLWVSDRSTQPVKVECHSSTGRVLKTVFYSRFRGFLGKPRPSELIVVDGTAPGRVTRIRFSEFVYRELQDEAYSPEAMPSVSEFSQSDRAAK